LANGESDLSAGLRALDKLTDLNLWGNTHAQYNQVLPFLTGLVKLDVRHNRHIESVALAPLTQLVDLTPSPHMDGQTLRQLVNLRVLWLYEAPLIGDDDLSALTSLTHLALGSTARITDYGLRTLTNLETLNLNNNDRVTDAVLYHLTGLVSLYLGDNARVSDAGLRSVSGLRHLSLCNNRTITAEGVRSLPHLSILTVTAPTDDRVAAVSMHCRVHDKW